ncbi:MAG: ribose 5-phosphate isomerase B [Syntrophales bacterium]|jgi:ribose 5-phosphate isomerase B|nr:ribose 5-phosphate isomerase B [Syntrophales bacterium]MDY0044364.1 ribose 5-phosphate isomerase B [Syntrophales bacterium]
MKIAIGSDHAGFDLKEEIKIYLTEKSAEVIDVGTYSPEPADYPDYGSAVARMTASGKVDRGILICGSGIGMSIVANRFTGVRAALCTDPETAELSRRHNDANILVLAGRRTSIDRALQIADIWLETGFEGGRHQKRLNKIESLAPVFHT